MAQKMSPRGGRVIRGEDSSHDLIRPFATVQTIAATILPIIETGTNNMANKHHNCI